MRAAYIALVREARLLQRHWLRKPPAGIPNVALLLERWLRIRDGSAAGGAAAEGEGGAAVGDVGSGAAAGPWAGESGTTSPALPVARASSGNSRRAVRVGAQLPLPAMDYVAFAGEASLEGPESLNSFMRGMLTLSTQPHTRFLGTRATSAYNASHLLCARRGVVTGTKNRFFTSRADAWMFRYYAYDFAGLLESRGAGGASTLVPHAHRPPATITLLSREVRCVCGATSSARLQR